MERDISEQNDDTQELSFLEHIEELRKRIIYVIIFIVVSSGVSAIFVNDIMRDIFLKPAIDANLRLQNLLPFGQPFLYFKVIFTTGLLISIPFLLYQVWQFITPALYETEKKWIGLATFFTSFCFLTGVVFSYFVLIPSMLSFAATFGSDLVPNNIDINEYFGFISVVLLASGLFFELPMLSFTLSKIGILTPKLLSKYRRHSIIVILILAAILTPTPDPISQLIFAVPILLLYELSILISWIVNKNRKK